MDASGCFVPEKEVLDKFGFEPTRLDTIFEKHTNPDIVTTLFISQGVVTLCEENVAEEEKDSCVFRLKDIPVANNHELRFILGKIYN